MIFTLAYSSLVTLKAQAQQAPPALTPRTVMPGVVVMLPSTWRPVSDSARAAAVRILDTALANSRNADLQASLRNGKPIVLLHETAPGVLDPSADLNVSPSPGAAPTMFNGASAAQLATALDPLCGVLRTGMTNLNTRVITCDRAIPDHGAGRTIAVTRLVRTGPRGFVTVWLAQYPDRDAIYTLTLSAPQAEEERYAALYQQIWRAMKLGGN